MPPKEPKWHENEHNNPLERPKNTERTFCFASQPHYRTYGQETHNQEKRQKNPKIRQKKSNLYLHIDIRSGDLFSGSGVSSMSC
jgi:hypothetical protein